MAVTELIACLLPALEGTQTEMGKRIPGARARLHCATQNIAEHDDGNVQGWKLKSRYPRGVKVTVVIDLNRNIREIDVQD